MRLLNKQRNPPDAITAIAVKGLGLACEKGFRGRHRIRPGRGWTNFPNRRLRAISAFGREGQRSYFYCVYFVRSLFLRNLEQSRKFSVKFRQAFCQAFVKFFVCFCKFFQIFLWRFWGISRGYGVNNCLFDAIANFLGLHGEFSPKGCGFAKFWLRARGGTLEQRGGGKPETSIALILFFGKRFSTGISALCQIAAQPRRRQAPTRRRSGGRSMASPLTSGAKVNPRTRRSHRHRGCWQCRGLSRPTQACSKPAALRQ